MHHAGHNREFLEQGYAVIFLHRSNSVKPFFRAVREFGEGLLKRLDSTLTVSPMVGGTGAPWCGGAADTHRLNNSRADPRSCVRVCERAQW